MALGGNTIWEVETGGNDTNNGGAFDPAQSAGMFTDGAATSANTSSPVFTSASYSFVAGDAGAWVYISSGTNWIKGWYKISSVAGGAATLSAAIGAAVLNNPVITPSTATGCATVASPTSATWSIDYSQQNSAQFTYTDLSSTGAGLTVSSAAHPFAKQQVGNSIVVTGGTNFTTGRYVIASVAAGVATVLGAANIHTGAGTDSNGAGGQGGALASPGQAGAALVAANCIFIKSATYTVTSASTNIAAGCLSITVNSTLVEGYATVRGDLGAIGASGTRPTIIAGTISTFTLIARTGTSGAVRNLILDGNSQTSSRGVTAALDVVYNVKGQNFTNSAFVTSGGNSGFFQRCQATGCSTAAAFLGGSNTEFADCVANANSITGFSLSASSLIVDSLSYGNTGASSDGFALGGGIGSAMNCSAYNNGRDGFRVSSSPGTLINCIAESNTGVGLNQSGNPAFVTFLNCGVFSNTGGDVATFAGLANIHLLNLGLVTATSSFFNNAAGGDFSLNNTAGAGAAARAAGYPGVLPAGLTTGFLDIGAAQHPDPPGFSGGIFGS